jgi:anti-sigma-K factor RskA
MTDERDFEAALSRVMKAEAADVGGAARIVQRLESRLPPQERSFAWWPAALTDWNFAPAWPRVAALACAAVLGVTVGLSSLGMRLAADLDLVRVASSDDTSGNAFDVDSVTGLRP